jgi:hypothetical protein
VAAATLSLALATALTTQASALTDQEAATVVTLIERLQPELGPIAYDEEEAEIWFARDAVRERLIVKAGFTRQSWRAAFDATMRGYIATIPQARIDALFKQMRQRLEQAPRMTAEQRATAVEFVAAERERLDAIRTAGRPDAEVVRPFSARLSRLMESEIGEGTAED